MNLSRLQYFVEAAKYENFTLAAQHLYTSQPNLSKQIALLEQKLGVQLFYRINRTIRLTTAGQYLYDQIKDIPDRLEGAFQRTKVLGLGTAGTLSIGILEGQELGPELLDHIHQFSEGGTDVAVNVERASFRQLRRGLSDGQYDMIATLAFELLDMPWASHRVIAHQEGAIAINRRNALSRRENLTLADLRDEDFVAISPEESPQGYANLFLQCAQEGFAPRVVREPTTLESLLLCVEANIGVAILDRNTRLERSDKITFCPVPRNEVADLIVAWRSENSSPLLKNLVAGFSSLN